MSPTRRTTRQSRQTTAAAVSASTTTTTSARTAKTSDEEYDKEESSSRPQLYLLKSEPHEFSIHDLKQKGREEWDGVRNYTARNFMRQMKSADRCWFYHSSCKTPAIVGTCRVARTARPDATALDPKHENYDAKSTPEKCRWDSVLVEFESLYETPITLKELRMQAKVNTVIANMMLLHRSRLSVMPVTAKEWQAVESLMQRKEQGEDLLMSTSITTGGK